MFSCVFFFDLSLRNSIADEPLILVNHRSVIIFMACCPERRDFAYDYTLRAFHARFKSFLTMKGRERKRKQIVLSGHSVLDLVQSIFKIYRSGICKNPSAARVRHTTNKYQLIQRNLYFLSKDSVDGVFWNKSVRLPIWQFYLPAQIKNPSEPDQHKSAFES